SDEGRAVRLPVELLDMTCQREWFLIYRVASSHQLPGGSELMTSPSSCVRHHSNSRARRLLAFRRKARVCACKQRVLSLPAARQWTSDSYLQSPARRLSRSRLACERTNRSQMAQIPCSFSAKLENRSLRCVHH